METKEKKYSYCELRPLLKEYTKKDRSFFAESTIKQLKQFHRLCWGYCLPAIIKCQQYDGEVKCFFFKHSGMKMKGVVAISLNFLDLYDIRFFELRGSFYLERKELFKENIYGEDLSYVIDGTIEL